MPYSSFQLQALLFEQIKTKIGNQPLANLLVPVLNLDRSTIYKKIKGQRPLGLEELLILAKHFDISIDELMKEI